MLADFLVILSMYWSLIYCNRATDKTLQIVLNYANNLLLNLQTQRTLYSNDTEPRKPMK